MSVSRQSIQPTPDITSESTRAFIEGVIATEQRMLRVIDIKAVLPPALKEDEG